MNLIDAVRSYLPSNLVDKVSGNLNESSSSITKAITAGVPTVLAGLINRVELGHASEVLRVAKETANSGILNDLQSLVNSKGNPFSRSLYKMLGMSEEAGGNLISGIARFAGIKFDSAQSLFGILAPLGLGVLGKHIQESNLSTQGLSSFLAGQKRNVMNAMPPGLSLGNLFGQVKETFDDLRNRRAATKAYADKNSKKSSGGFVWLILIAVAIALLWFLFGKGCNNAAKTTPGSDTTTKSQTTVPGTGRDTIVSTDSEGRVSMKVKLSNGIEIDAFKGGVEDQFVNCLNDTSCTAGKNRWFDFDNINFETGSAMLTGKSAQQINNIVAILKAYPKVKIKIGGYTDKTGNAASNKKLSQQRADAVLAAIKNAGANGEQLTGSEGYGSGFAKAEATAPDAERKKDRRIAIQLREK